MVVQWHPGLASDRFGGDEGAVVGGGRRVDAEPALGGPVAIEVDARPSRVAHADGDRRVGGNRDRRRDDQLVRGALLAVLARAAHLGRARGRIRVGRADRVDVRDRMGQRIRVVGAVGVAGIGRLLEGEGRRSAVDRDRLDVHVRPRGIAGEGRALEVEAEVREALRRADRQVRVVARQEQVRGGVIDDVQIGVEAPVSAVALIWVDAVTELGQRSRTRRAGTVRLDRPRRTGDGRQRRDQRDGHHRGQACAVG